MGMSKPYPADDYQAQDDFRTLQRAEEVKGDGGRHKKAIAHGKTQMKAMSKVIGGRRMSGKR